MIFFKIYEKNLTVANCAFSWSAVTIHAAFLFDFMTAVTFIVIKTLQSKFTL